MNGQQLEMRFDSQFRPLIRRRRCSTRARWWFAQMRQVVDRAWDREQTPPARPEQVYMPLSRAPGQNWFLAPGRRRELIAHGVWPRAHGR